MITVVIPVYNAQDSLAHCLDAVFSSNYARFECITVDDNSSDASSEINGRFPTTTLQVEGGPKGPANARNIGAQAAHGELLFFIDADVVVRPDTLSLIAETFQSRPDISALFGSYDDDPAGPEFLTQYKNLVHHFVHQQGNEDAATFWTGCGAIRREIFLEMGGFDAERYPQPSIEDIELGYRMKAAGHKILLKKEIQVKHLKKWSLMGLIKTDVFSRALPWTRLIMQEKNLPNDLNLQTSQRASALLLGLLLLFLGVNVLQDNFVLLPLMTGLFLAVVNSWHWREEPLRLHMSAGMTLFTFASMGLMVVLAMVKGLMFLLGPLLILLALLIFATLPINLAPPGRRVMFASMTLALALCFLGVYVSFPYSVAAPIVLILLVIILLNRDLYWFFARKRGVVFALAALPMQLFYYFYSVLTFLSSSGLHLWQRRLKIT